MLLTYSFSEVRASKKRLMILASTFPVYQITRNIIDKNQDIKVELLLPAELGCPHNYSLTPRDMKKLVEAEILITNGFGLEAFLDNALKKANPDIKRIDTSKGIKETLFYSCSHAHHDNNHKHSINPHLFVSPKLSAKLAKTISEELSILYPAGSVKFKKNSELYTVRMRKLSAKFSELGKNLKNDRVIQPHGVFDYLARDIGLKIVATLMQEGQGPSAAGIMKLVKTIKRERVGAIISEPQYPDKVEKILSKETKVPIIKLDPVASGPLDAPLDYYDKKMDQNLKKIKETLGKDQK